VHSVVVQAFRRQTKEEQVLRLLMLCRKRWNEGQWNCCNGYRVRCRYHVSQAKAERWEEWKCFRIVCNAYARCVYISVHELCAVPLWMNKYSRNETSY
jgi:hypothetical protein